MDQEQTEQKVEKLPGAARLLLTPSWLSSLVGVVVGVGVVVAGLVISNYPGSQLQEAIYQAHQQHFSSGYQTIIHNLSKNSFLADVPSVIIWGFTGLVVYYAAIGIYQAFVDAVELKEELHYVHASRRNLLRQTGLRLLVRIIALAGWFIALQVSLHYALPYCLALADGRAGLTVSTVAKAYLAAVILYGAVHLNAIFFRLVVLRPRVFSAAPVKEQKS